jgi:hypothetical protein
MVTDGQVRVLRRKLLMEGKTQEAAAAGAGMSVRSARHWQAGPYPSQAHKPHLWRTRPDPLAGVFDSDIAPLLAADERRLLEARTLLGELDRRHPGCFSVSQLRTLQRRIREWRALHGPEQEVYFPQDHPPGREAAFDFTNCNALGVTIGGEPFTHLLFELALSYSGWRWQMVAASESFEALAAGVQGALWELGGVSEVLRSDNLSAATHDLRRSRGRALTRRYRELLDHYGLRASLIQVGEAHENGVVEQAHRRTKSTLAQALLLRGSCDFASIEDYEHWVLRWWSESTTPHWENGCLKSGVICGRCRRPRFPPTPRSPRGSAGGARSECRTGPTLYPHVSSASASRYGCMPIISRSTTASG